MSARRSLRVRRARRDDAPAIVEMARTLANWLGNTSPAIDEPAVLRNCFGRERWANCLVAKLGGEAVGYAIFCPTFEGHIGNRQIYLSDLFVRPEARRSGAGRALMQAVARHAVANGCVAVTWELWVKNALGRAVYERLGCVVSEEVNPMRLEGEALAALARG
jgi:ribosomal protein S18 acetylase RimI-like enzyme